MVIIDPELDPLSALTYITSVCLRLRERDELTRVINSYFMLSIAW